MKTILDLIVEELKPAFIGCGYDEKYIRVTVSNRPDLCEYQCNGAMAAAKAYKKKPIDIANGVVEQLKDSEVFEEVNAVMPGFINLKLDPAFLSGYMNGMKGAKKLGMDEVEKPETIVIDYGGANVAKPLHVGHLRSAVIGEALKRMGRFVGHKVIGDVHLGDWGLQMGLIIEELKDRKPELPYFDENFTGEYPEEAPFTISELEEIYPAASGKSKVDEAFKERAQEATFKLQSGVKGYRALWKQIIKISVADMKRNYDNLNVTFDLWKGESDVHDVIPGMVDYMKKEGYAYISDGALVVDVKEDTDTKEIPPCMILKSDGASLYNTTDLATIMERMREYHPDQMIYLTDKRQDLYFEQVFRCARKTKLVDEDTELVHIGFGTVNGADGHAFKTRDGGVMRLEMLINEINEKMYQKIVESREVDEEEARNTAKIIALSAIKYGDLSNQASKDYIFDIDKFTSFEGDTGPYILYTIVRIKSILAKAKEQGEDLTNLTLKEADTDSQKALMMTIARFNAMMENAYDEVAPHKICAYIYDLANTLNRFYHENRILAEEDETKKRSWLGLLILTKEILEACIDVLGFGAPERM